MTNPKELMEKMIKSISALPKHITDDVMMLAVAMIIRCEGNVITTGIGKSAIVAQKLAATLSSTGTKAFYVNPVDALHGDFGKIKHQDIIIAISKSGATKETLEFIQRCRVIKLCKVILISAKPGSKMSCFANHSIFTNQVEEIGGLMKLAPNVSTICAMIVGDVLAMCIAEEEEFTEQQYRVNHPNGIVE